MKLRTLGVILIVVGLVGLVGTSWAFAALYVPTIAPGPIGPYGGVASCTPPALQGQVVDVTLADMGGMMGGPGIGMLGRSGMMGGHMMTVTGGRATVPAGEVSLRARNTGMMVHELLVLPLTSSAPGTRAVGADGRVDETGSLGEASKSCGEGEGDGIAPGSASWVTLRLAAGRYELFCNEPGHYAMGMFTELDVR